MGAVAAHHHHRLLLLLVAGAFRVISAQQFFHLTDLHIEPFFDATQANNHICRAEACQGDAGVDCTLWANIGGCQSEADVHFVGGDISTFTADSTDDCCAGCTAEPMCMAFSYNPTSKECALKDSRDGRTSEVGYISGPASITGADFNTYGKPGCDPPIGMLNSMLTAMHAVENNPEFILISGDLSAHDLPCPVAVQVQAAVITLIRNSFPGIPVLSAVGNNDNCPKDVNTPSEFKRLSGLYAQDAYPLEENRKTFQAGGYYVYDPAVNRTSDSSTPRVIVFNSQLMVPKFFPDGMSATDVDTADTQLVWLKAQLQDARDSSVKVVLDSHWPPGRFQDSDEWFSAYQDTFITLVESYADTVLLQCYGHHSTELIRSFSPQFSGIISSGGAPRTGRFPVFQVIPHDGSTAQDVVTYFLNLDQVALDVDSVQQYWNLLYSMKEVYAINDVSAASLYAASFKITNSITYAGAYLIQQFRLVADAEYNVDKVFTQMVCETSCQSEAAETLCVTRITGEAASQNTAANVFQPDHLKDEPEFWKGVLTGAATTTVIVCLLTALLYHLRTKRSRYYRRSDSIHVAIEAVHS